MDPRENAIQLIRDLITAWGIKEEDAKDKTQENLWWFIQGSANFHVQIFSFDKGNEKRDAIEVGATVMLLPEDPAKKNALYEHVMGMNSTAVGCWWGSRNNKLMLFSTRELTGLDRVELNTMIDDVRFYADYFDDIFKEKFGSIRGPQ